MALISRLRINGSAISHTLQICLAHINKDVIFSTVRKLLPLHVAAWEVAHLSISQMVNASPGEERTQLMKRWRESALSQLSQVGIIVSSLDIAASKSLGR